MKNLLITTALCAGFSTNAFAGNFATNLTQGWGGEASLSGSTTSGNTKTTDIGLALHLTKQNGAWTNKFDTTYDLGKSGGVDNKNRFFIGYQLDRQINDRLYAYGNVNYYTDDFGAYKQGSFIGTGLGYKVIQENPLKWNVEAGIGYKSQKLREIGIIPSIKTDEFAVRGASDFGYIFSEAVSFYNKSEVIWSESDTYLWNDTGITANLAGNLAARFSFRVDHHTDVPFGVKKTDTITRAAIVYTLK
ncbi:MAG: hypothetical protein COA43_03855 [Robiginitomaculum sp.]|nr:MAG: hypothetical protein COA43_03855 [Robiginitomaculum sp.]